MAVTQSRDNRTLIAAADLSGSQFHFAKMDSAGKAAICGNGDAAFGVIEVGGTAGAASTITVRGKVMVKCGAAVTIGDDVGIDAAGKAVNAASGDIIVGRAYETGANNQLIAIELSGLNTVAHA